MAWGQYSVPQLFTSDDQSLVHLLGCSGSIGMISIDPARHITLLLVKNGGLINYSWIGNHSLRSLAFSVCSQCWLSVLAFVNTPRKILIRGASAVIHVVGFLETATRLPSWCFPHMVQPPKMHEFPW